jgi:cytochrome c553
MRITWLRAIALFALMAAAAAAVVASGVVSIKASSGHWPITAWLLDYAKRRSVALHSLAIAAPPLDDRALVVRGAGHYEMGCRQCHGSPGTPMPRIPERMTPHPPPLRAQVTRWTPEELFYIVKHGIKFTGMPAWPAAERDDEVWAMVAFLRVLPGLDRDAYDRLVFGIARGSDPAGWPEPADSVSRVVQERCARCHGVDGEGRPDAAIPALAAQRSGYLSRALHAYARGARRSGTMMPIAAELDASMVGGVAAYYADLARSPSAASAGDVGRGEAIAMRGVPGQDVPPCSECHGPAPSDRNPAYPLLNGQPRDYLFQQLQLFAEDRRGGSEYAHLMRRVAVRLTADQMSDAARYYSTLPVPSPRPQ